MQDAVSGVTHTVEVTAQPESPVASVLANLPLGAVDQPWFVGAQRVDVDATIGDSPLLPGAVLTQGSPGPDARALPPGVVGAVRVLEGPDAGRMAWLPPGEYLIARHPEAAICLRDPEVSRQHARVQVTPDGQARISDHGSSNGTLLSGQPIAQDLLPWPPRAVVEVGADLLEWVPLGSPPRAPVRGRDARLDFDRAFAVAPEAGAVEVRLPAPVDGVSGGRAAMVAGAVVPLILGLVLAALLRQPTMLLMGLFGPLTWAMTAVLERRQVKARRARFAADRAAAEAAMAVAVTDRGAGPPGRGRPTCTTSPWLRSAIERGCGHATPTPQTGCCCASVPAAGPRRSTWSAPRGKVCSSAAARGAGDRRSASGRGTRCGRSRPRAPAGWPGGCCSSWRPCAAPTTCGSW